MNNPNWCDVLGWTTDHIQELRFAGYTYLKEGKYDIAKTYFEALIILDPKNAYDFQTLGAIYLIQNDFQKALKTLSNALKLDPTHLGSRLNHAKTLLYLGRIQEGLEEATELLQCDDVSIANDAQALILAYGS